MYETDIDQFLDKLYQEIRDFEATLVPDDDAYWAYCLKLFGETLMKRETEYQLDLPAKWCN